MSASFKGYRDVSAMDSGMIASRFVVHPDHTKPTIRCGIWIWKFAALHSRKPDEGARQSLESEK